MGRDNDEEYWDRYNKLTETITEIDGAVHQSIHSSDGLGVSDFQYYKWSDLRDKLYHVQDLLRECKV